MDTEYKISYKNLPPSMSGVLVLWLALLTGYVLDLGAWYFGAISVLALSSFVSYFKRLVRTQVIDIFANVNKEK